MSKVIDPKNIDRTGETLTPEEAQKREAAEEGKAAEEAEAKAKAEAEAKSKEESEAKAAEEAKAKEEAEAKAKAEAEGKPENIKKRSIYDDLKDKKKEAREAKSEAETVKAENEALKAENAALKELAKKSKKAETDEEKEEIEEDIKEIAEAIGGDPKAIKTLTDFLSKKLKNGVGLSKEDLDTIRSIKEKQSKKDEESEAKAAFNKEWDTFVPDLKKDFPHVSAKELEAVQAEMFRLAHTTKFHDKEMDYIYFRSKDALSKLISPKRPSMEGGNNALAGEGSKGEAELSSKSSPIDVMKAMESKSTSSTEIRKSQ